MPIAVITDVRTGETIEREMTPEEVAALAPTVSEARAQRNALLAASDWSQLPDAPVDQAAWAAYRQALRDVPGQADFPANIAWPQKP